MNLGASDSAWWDDWLKFVPGWLAFLGTLVSAWRRRVHRKYKLALGPDGVGLRDALTMMRGLFLEVCSGERAHRRAWFENASRYGAVFRLADQAQRPGDSILQDRVADVTEHWMAAKRHALDTDPFQGSGRFSKEQEQVELNNLNLQREQALQGVEAVAAALARMNELESRTHGR
ncbi:hypothetical protein [Streptomyces phaeochromogenes]